MARKAGTSGSGYLCSWATAREFAVTGRRRVQRGTKAILKKLYPTFFGTVDIAVNQIQQHIADLDGRPNLPPAYRAIVDEAKDRINPSAGGAGCLQGHDRSRAFDAVAGQGRRPD